MSSKLFSKIGSKIMKSNMLPAIEIAFYAYCIHKTLNDSNVKKSIYENGELKSVATISLKEEIIEQIKLKMFKDAIGTHVSLDNEEKITDFGITIGNKSFNWKL
jgi:hypothetical protein